MAHERSAEPVAVDNVVGVREIAVTSSARTFTEYSADSWNLVGATPAGESPSCNIDVAIGHARQTRGTWHEVRTNT
jgi:hypothetical protein